MPNSKAEKLRDKKANAELEVEKLRDKKENAQLQAVKLRDKKANAQSRLKNYETKSKCPTRG
jgi:hypothetical protein